MAQYIFEQDGDYVNFNGGGNLWRLHKDSNCVAWHWDETGDLFFDVYDQAYVVKAENIGEVIVGGVTLTTAADFATEIVNVFTGIGSGSAGGSILSATVELTDAQIKALPTTGVELVPAQGVNKMLVVLFGTLRWNCTGAYTNVNADNSCGIAYGNSGTNDWIDYACAPTTIREGTGIRTSLLNPALSPHPTAGQPDIVFTYYNNFPEADFNNTNMVVYADNFGSGDLTGGNAANTLKVTVYYVVVDL